MNEPAIALRPVDGTNDHDVGFVLDLAVGVAWGERDICDHCIASAGSPDCSENPGGEQSSVEHLTEDGPTVFEHVCRMGMEGIVSKRTDSPCRSGPSKTWLKAKIPASEAVRREREEDWGR